MYKKTVVKNNLTSNLDEMHIEIWIVKCDNEGG